MFSFQLTRGELDLENILKQITPETHEEISSEKNIERLRRDDVISDEMKAVINNLPLQEEKVTEKRDTGVEANKKFSVVKLPDATKNQTALPQQPAKLNTVPVKNNAEVASDDVSSGSGGDSESGSGASESGSGESETVSEKRSSVNLMAKNDAKLAMSIEDSSDDASGSGSGDDEGSADVGAAKRNLMESQPAQPVAGVPGQGVNVALPNAVKVPGNVSKVVTLNPGGYNEAPMLKQQANKTDGNATLTEIKYFKPQENTTEVMDKVNQSANQSMFNQNSTFSNVLNTAATNLTKPGNTSTKTGTKKDTLPDEVSNVADNLFTFENDDEGKSVGATEGDDSLPGSQGK